MKRVRSGTASLPLLPLPSGVETIASPASVTMLVAADAHCMVAEGARVAAGFPLCNRPDPGSFASVNGTVRRIMPWDAGTRGRFTAIIIDRGREDGAHRLFDPVSDPMSLEGGDLRKKATMAGFRFPDMPIPLLVSMLDEDVDRVVNRWSAAGEFDRILAGLRLLRHMNAASGTVIAVDPSLGIDKRKHCEPFGTVITVPARYPDTVARQIIRQNPGLFPGGCAAVIDSKRLLDFETTISTGGAPIAMRVSLRIGRRGPVRLFDVPVGLHVGDLLAQMNCMLTDGMMVVMGGEMAGAAADSGAQPIVDGCDSLLVLSQGDTFAPENTPCVNCGRCVRVCPQRLRVDLIGKNVEFSREKDAVRLGIHQCIDCGLCTVACIVHRPLGHLLAYGKTIYARVPGREGAA